MEPVLLHALPFDASMWRLQRHHARDPSHVPTLYDLGDRLEDWADAVLAQVTGERLVVVGNSIGGSCALEMAAKAPDRIAALVLVGTKAAHRPDPALHRAVMDMLEHADTTRAWDTYWKPLFAPTALPTTVNDAKRMMGRLSAEQLAIGVNAFHSRTPRTETLAELTCPVICVTVEHDTAPGRATMAAQARAARNGHLIVAPDCGHYVPLEQPKTMDAIIQKAVDAVA